MYLLYLRYECNVTLVNVRTPVIPWHTLAHTANIVITNGQCTREGRMILLAGQRTSLIIGDPSE